MTNQAMCFVYLNLSAMVWIFVSHKWYVVVLTAKCLPNSCGFHSCPNAGSILISGPGIEPMSPALEGGFLTTRPPEKTSLVAQTVKRLSTMRESQVRSLGWEDPLEKEMAIHSRTIAWKIPWTEEPGRLQPMGSQRVRHDWATSLFPNSLLWSLLPKGMVLVLGGLWEVFKLWV